MNMPSSDTIIADTRQWLEQIVVGLNVCPFARKPLNAGLVHFAVSDSRNVETLLVDLYDELERLDRTPAEQIDTTLLIIPDQLDDFLDYNDMLDLAVCRYAGGRPGEFHQPGPLPDPAYPP